MSDADETIRRLLVRADELRKAAPARRDAEVVRAGVAGVLQQARDQLPHVADERRRRDLAAAITRRLVDLDREDVMAMLGPSPGISRAPTRGVDPSRVPPGQHLTAGFPVLHVGGVPPWTRDDVRLTVTGLVRERRVHGLEELRGLPTTRVTRDFHCVTTWTRLDVTWTGVRVKDVLATAGVREHATHLIASGHPAYSANLPLSYAMDDDVLVAWEVDGRPLPAAHGGPLRLVVPALYGWKSVKWLTELRLLDRDVPGYWEERGYHMLGDPWREQRFGDDA